MPVKNWDITPRNFNPMSTPGLSEEACKAVNAGFDAMSTWRIETAKYGREKQRASAREDGCSCSGVGITGGNRARQPRANAEHHQNADPYHMMDAWEEQIKAPAGSPSEILSLAQPRRFEIAAMSPFQFWIQFTEQ